MTEEKRNQCNDIIRYLKANKTISHIDADRKLGCTRLSARIYDLKKDGWVFDDRMIYYINEDGRMKKYKEYTLIGYGQVS